MATQQAEAATAGALAQAAQSRTIQLAISAAVARDVARLWPNLDRKALDKSFPSWLNLMIALVERYHGMSSLAAQVYYDDVRAAQTGIPTPDGLVKLAPTPPREWLTKAFGFSGPGILRDGAYQDSTALTTTQGTAARIAQSGGRDTVIRTVENDPKAVGWFRVTDGSPCAFCALLASRGVVNKSKLYKSAKSFDRSNASFEGPGTAKVHNDCGCAMAPAFTHDQELPDVSRRAAQVYADMNPGPVRDVLPAFRKAWKEHLAQQAAPDQAA